MKNPISKKLNIPEGRIYLVIILFFVLILLYFDHVIGGLALVLFLFLLFYNWKVGKERREEWYEYLEDLSDNIDWGTKNAVSSIPMPFVVIEVGGTITWFNLKFGDLFKGEKLLERNIHDFVPELTPNHFDASKDESYHDITFGDKRYRVHWVPVKTGVDNRKDKVIFLIYWQDITEGYRLNIIYEARKLVISYIYIDNYNEVIANTPETSRPAVIAEIDSRLTRWAGNIDACLVKYERDKFVVIMEEQYLGRIQKNRFEILNNIREINLGNKIPVTLSIGVGQNADSPALASNSAKSAIELALGRGGDQAVVKEGTKLNFYGGKSQGVAKRTKVRSRVIANALRELIEHSKHVLIMSHEIPDVDSIGSALGIYRCAKHVGREANIILNESNASVDYLINLLNENKMYEELFISKNEALNSINKDTLLIVVDTHRPSFTEAPELLEYVEKVVVIDHHRRSTEYIEGATLSYMEPYASSASELVTEILQYFDDNIKIEAIEADALLAGITMDTKNFVFNTGVRTYEAASYLRRIGANPAYVRQFYQDDMQTYAERAETVKNAEIIKPGIAISQCPSNIKNAHLVAAQAADSLLNIRGISASLVLSEAPEGVMISGRSLGKVNMQVVLEKLGGGGHLTMAGAQLGHISIEEAKQLVINALDEYLEEGESK